jgi:hypothetical protein
VSELSDILDEAEVERLIAEQANLIFQRNAVQARIDEISRALTASGEARLLYNPENVAEVTHACPPDDGGGLMPCCGLTPFEVPRTDRMTLDPELVTCGKEGGQS